MKIDKKDLTKEMVGQAMQCTTADDLMALARAKGFDLSKEEAEAYMAELADVELDEAQLNKAAGGGCYPDCKNDYCFEN